MKTLILVPGMDFYFFNHLRSDDMEIHAVFPVMHGIKSVLCKLFRKIGCNGSFVVLWRLVEIIGSI